MRPFRVIACYARAAAALLLAATTPLAAQQPAGVAPSTRSPTLTLVEPTPEPIFACHTPIAGVLYLIKKPGLLESCLTIGGVAHGAISWNHKGPKGDPGDPGPSGGVGLPGDKGPTGPAGEQGPVGDKGETGDKGAAGAAGAPGDAGPPGEKGAAGVIGPAGEAGPAGDKGPPGDRGAVGEKGLIGDKGATGDPGAPGEKGAIGNQGLQGDKGATGDPGAPGEKGAVGDPGPIGDKGPTGDKGPIGVAGAAGNLPCDNGCVTTAMIANAAVTNAKLSPITEPGKIANSATTAIAHPQSAQDFFNRIVARDGSGVFGSHDIAVMELDLPLNGVIAHAGSAILRRNGGADAATANIFVGASAGGNATATQNVGVGANALQRVSQTGNTGVGLSALQLMTSGVGNTAVGMGAMDLGLFNGGRNVAIGFRAGRSLQSSGTVSPFRNILIGWGAGGGLDVQSNNIFIGFPLRDGSSIHIGDNALHTRAFVAGIAAVPVAGAPIVVNATTGQLGVAGSSARFKTGISDLGDASITLGALRPVSYRYRTDLDPAGAIQYGLIAEEVDRVAPDLVVRDSSGHPFTVRYELLVPLLVDEIQRRRALVAALMRDQAVMLRRLEELEAAIRR